MINFNYWKILFTDRVSVNKKYLTDSVSVNKKFLTDSGVPILVLEVQPYLFVFDSALFWTSLALFWVLRSYFLVLRGCSWGQDQVWANFRNWGQVQKLFWNMLT